MQIKYQFTHRQTFFGRPVFLWLLVLQIMVLTAVSQAATDPAMALWDLYKQGRFEEVIQQGKAMLNTGTESGSILLAVGRSLADTNRHGEAVFFLQRAVASDQDKTWVYAWGQIYLGKCRFQQGESEQAQAALLLARDCGATQNATGEAIGNLLIFGLAASYDYWTSYETEHFHFRFSPSLIETDQQKYAQQHENIYDYVSTWFGGGPSHKIHFLVWADKQEARLAGMPELGFSLPEFCLSHVRLEQTVGHEMTHVIAYHAVNPSLQAGLINEGTAVVFDGTSRNWLQLAKQALASQAADRGLEGPVPISVMALWKDWSLQTPDVSYPVAGAFVNMLIQQGGRELFLEAFREQTPEFFMEIYGEKLKGWIRDFDEQLNEK